MRNLFFAAILAMSECFTTQASADVRIDIYRDSQTMTVAVDGAHAYTWKVSTGRSYNSTRAGKFGVQFLSRHHRSSLYNWAPMPHSIFYDGNRAIHGTTEEARLGSRASHGCVRLHRSNAATLFGLVQKRLASTRIVVH